MSANRETARQFFEACETGKGWQDCSAFGQPGATFSSQTGALADISTMEAYTEWMKGLLTPLPDGHYELKFFGEDEARNSLAAFAVFHGTQNWTGRTRTANRKKGCCRLCVPHGLRRKPDQAHDQDLE